MVDRIYTWFLKTTEVLQAPFLLAIRLYWGWQFWQSGTGKLSNISNVVSYFTDLGVPALHFNAYLVAYLEAAGGILLILGLGSRLIALPLVVNMIVAYVTADREALGFIFSSDSAEKFYEALPFTYLFVSLIILFFGPGPLSLDTIIKWHRTNKRQPRAAPAAATPDPVQTL